MAKLKDIIVESIKALPEIERKVVVLYYYERLRFPDIGEVLEIPATEAQALFESATVTMGQAVKDGLDARCRA